MNRPLIQNGNGEQNRNTVTAANAMMILVTGNTTGVSAIDFPT